MRSGAKRCHFCSDANVACEPGAPLVVTPRSEFRALISGGGVPGAVSVPPSEAQLPPLTGTGSSGSYDIVNRPTVFPPAVSSQDSFTHHVSFAPPHDRFLNFRRNTDAFLFTEYNNIILEMTRLYAMLRKDNCNWVSLRNRNFCTTTGDSPVVLNADIASRNE